MPKWIAECDGFEYLFLAVQGTPVAPVLHKSGLSSGGNGSSSPNGNKQKSAAKRGVFTNGILPTSQNLSPVLPATVDNSFPPVNVAHNTNPDQRKGSSDMANKAPAVGGSYEHGLPSPNQRADGPPFPHNNLNRRNMGREQGRGGHGWHHGNKNYGNARDVGLPFQQQRVGPRNLPRPPSLFYNTNAGFFPTAGFQSKSLLSPHKLSLLTLSLLLY